ncbi:MAG: S26 family signal peptidase [Reinekea sp.]
MLISRLLNLLLWLAFWIGLLFFRPLFIGGNLYRINGDSMLPDYANGEIVYVSLKSNIAFMSGDVVVAKPTQFPKIVIKRVSSVRKNNSNTELFFTGDNAALSFDSRMFGWVNEADVIGLVKWKL